MYLVKGICHDEGENYMNCQEFEELLGAYVLDAVSNEERQAVDAHLAECSRCKHTVEQLQEIVNLFPLSVPAIDPPTHLKPLILARIQADQVSREIPAQLQVMVAPNSRRARRSIPLLAAALILLFIFFGAMIFWNVVLQQQIAQLSQREAPPVTYAIHAANGSTSTGEIIYYSQQHIVVLVLHDLPQLSGTELYQGWLFQGQQPTSIGLFNRVDNTVTLDFQGDIGKYNRVAVSLEKGPALSSSPQGPVLATGSLKKT